MAIPTITTFRNEFPEFSSVEDATITAVLTRAYRLHSATQAGTLYAAAHLYSLDQEKNASLAPDGGAGVVSKESIGARSVEYKTNVGEGERRTFWSRSPYGREFMKLEERNVRQGMPILMA